MTTDQKPSYMVADPDASAAHDAGEEMTDKQAVILRDLCEKLGEPMDGSLTHAQAEERIGALQSRLDDTTC